MESRKIFGRINQTLLTKKCVGSTKNFVALSRKKETRCSVGRFFYSSFLITILYKSIFKFNELKIFLWKKIRFRLRSDSSPGLSIAGRLRKSIFKIIYLYSLNLNQSNFHWLNQWFSFSLIHHWKNIFHC